MLIGNTISKMSLNITFSNNELFFQAIHHPDSVEKSVFLALIEKYPYAQSLRFSYERKLFGENNPIQNLSSTLLYASSPNWLYEFMHSKQTISTAVIELEDVVFDADEDELQELIAPEAEGFEEPEKREIASESIVVEGILPESDLPSGPMDELDRLIQAGVAKDYFRSKDQEEIGIEADAPAIDTIQPEEVSDAQERISVYDDDTMPYSFLWWLHKTRLEYADTYQPYVKSPLGPMMPSNDDIAKIHEKLDSQLLDQQIRENIFHLQSPEAKLSDEVKTTISFQIPRKTDEVIEKFIREEPIIQPLQAEKLDLENKARKSSEDQHPLVTETLAKIYMEQGLYPKAIEVYKKLVLKYPEKNAYFAARITELEKKLN